MGPIWKNLKRFGYLTLFLLFAVTVYALSVAIENSLQDQKQQLSDIEIMVIKGNPTWDEVGAIKFIARNRWYKDEVGFIDYGFDGDLDQVICLKGRDERKEYDPNSPDWTVWTDRYLEVRTEATSGKKEPLL